MSRAVRRDPLTGEEVILSADRILLDRPPAAPDRGAASCPFCPGHEAHTRPTIDAVERHGAWVARAFANRRPALVVEEVLRASVDGPFEQVSGVGAHEVLVEAPEHAPLHTLPVERAIDALGLAARRLRDLRGDTRLRTLTWFRNVGPGAGASEAHPHAQIVGLPVVPRRVAGLVGRSREHWRRHGRPLLRDVLAAELDEGTRLLARDGPVVALCPFAPRHPFEVWFVPLDPGPGLADATGEELAAAARLMHRVQRALDRAVGPAPSTAVALGAAEGEPSEGLGWHLRLAPRLLVPGGLEEATGAALHPVFPEEAARVLRGALEPARPAVP